MRTILVMLIVALAAACEYAGPAGNPIATSLTWFSYVGGEDIERSCRPGAPDRLRFVYNAVYDEQVRSYDVRVLANGRSATLAAFARDEPDLTRATAITDPLSAWRGVRAESVLALSSVVDLRETLRAARFESFKPTGLLLPSNEYYWVVTACLDGRFQANAWLFPTERYKLLKFPHILLSYDRTGVPFRQAVPEARRPYDPPNTEGDNPTEPFYLQLEGNRVLGGRAVFH